MTKRQWKRETSRLPKWKELKEAKAEMFEIIGKYLETKNKKSVDKD